MSFLPPPLHLIGIEPSNCYLHSPRFFTKPLILQITCYFFIFERFAVYHIANVGYCSICWSSLFFHVLEVFYYKLISFKKSLTLARFYSPCCWTKAISGALQNSCLTSGHLIVRALFICLTIINRNLFSFRFDIFDVPVGGEFVIRLIIAVHIFDCHIIDIFHEHIDDRLLQHIVLTRWLSHPSRCWLKPFSAQYLSMLQH